jgi:hypothetical protein
MASGDYSPVFESRYAAFIIWSIFVLAFIVIPFLLFGRICRCICLASLRSRRQQENEDEEDYTTDNGGRPVYSVWDVEYMHLTQSKKQKINEMRAREISKCLTAYSLMLSTENMVEHDKVLVDQEEFDASQDCINVEDAKEATVPSSIEPSSIEPSSIEPSSSSEEEASINEEANYTHICVPQPGYNKNGLRKLKKKPKSSNSTPENTPQRMMCLILSRKKKDANTQAKELSEIEDHDAEDDDTMQRKDEKRQVSIFCAICLGEYESNEKVCWSSNMECTHVFHHDCMLQWLKSLGKRVCRQQRFSEHPSVKQVLNFSIECPCCRQSFIDRSVDVGVDDIDIVVGVGDDENV